MKILYNRILIVMAFFLPLVIGCSDDETYIENVAGISLEGVEGNLISLIENDTYELKVKVNPENAANLSKFTTFNYTSSEQTIFTVSGEGVITALSPGDAILTVSAQEDATIKLLTMVRVSKRIYPVTSIEVKELDKALFVEGMSIDLSNYISVLPDNASDNRLNITSSNEEVASFDKDNANILNLLASGKVTISIKTTDGSNISKDLELNILSKDAIINFVPLDRTNWTITSSHVPIPDGSIGGDNTVYLFDNNNNTGLSLYKPGKQGTPKEDLVGFTVELSTATPINAFRLTHRKFGYDRLSPYAIDLLGSNDGENFTVIFQNIPTLYVAGSSEVQVTRMLPLGNTEAYKFVKIVYSNYDAANGNTVQVMEFELGTGTLE